MPGLTLLNVDSIESNNKIQDIKQLLDDIYSFTKRFPGDTMSARLVPLKMKLKQLQDVISQFGQDGSIEINEKQSTIMQLHSELQMLTNSLVKYKSNFSDYSEICSNYLLNHLCTTAAVDPRAAVIGVSNTMAQVLSNDIQIIEDPQFTTSEFDPKYFENFSLKFNHMLTIAGLFSAPVLGLPDIPISQLGSWSDQALSQFAAIYKFIDDHYKPLKFYKMEKELKASAFDTSGDILSFYIYINEFFAALIARADLLSGIEFPAEFTKNKKSIILQSTSHINAILATSIEINCDIIEDHISTLIELFNNGIIDRNENPANNKELMNYMNEIGIWRLVAKFANLMQIFFEDRQNDFKLNPEDKNNILQKIATNDELPTIRVNPTDIELQLVYFVHEIDEQLNKLFPQLNSHDMSEFIISSDFTKFRQFLQYIIHTVAAHDIFLDIEILWTPWLNSIYGKFYLESTTGYNPLGSLEAGILSIFLGIKENSPFLTQDGINMLNNTKKYLEFQLHNYFAIEVITRLVQIGVENIKEKIDEIIDFVDSFLKEYQISPNSLLFQRANLYKGMLTIYKLPSDNDDEDPFTLMNSRYVSFDPFSWIILPKNFKPIIPYIPLNTSLANLYAG